MFPELIRRSLLILLHFPSQVGQIFLEHGHSPQKILLGPVGFIAGFPPALLSVLVGTLLVRFVQSFYLRDDLIIESGGTHPVEIRITFKIYSQGDSTY